MEQSQVHIKEEKIKRKKRKRPASTTRRKNWRNENLKQRMRDLISMGGGEKRERDSVAPVWLKTEESEKGSLTEDGCYFLRGDQLQKFPGGRRRVKGEGGEG